MFNQGNQDDRGKPDMQLIMTPSGTPPKEIAIRDGIYWEGDLNVRNTWSQPIMLDHIKVPIQPDYIDVYHETDADEDCTAIHRIPKGRAMSQVLELINPDEAYRVKLHVASARGSFPDDGGVFGIVVRCIRFHPEPEMIVRTLVAEVRHPAYCR